MRKIHKYILYLIFIFVTVYSYARSLVITETISLNLVTFFSIAFGFYMTSIAIIFNSNYAKKLYKETDPINFGNRKIHTLKKYLLYSGYWSIFSIVSIIISSLRTNQSVSNIIKINLHFIELVNFSLDINKLITSLVLSISAVNVYFMILLLNTILDGLLEESKNELS